MCKKADDSITPAAKATNIAVDCREKRKTTAAAAAMLINPPARQASRIMLKVLIFSSSLV
jgi:hypothetical protein